MHQYGGNDPCSCTASSYLAPHPASGNAAHDTKGAADAEKCSTASAAAQVRSIWTTADCCNLHTSQLLCPDSRLCAQGRVPSTIQQQRAAPNHAAQTAPSSHDWSLGGGGGLHAGKACRCSSNSPLLGPVRPSCHWASPARSGLGLAACLCRMAAG